MTIADFLLISGCPAKTLPHSPYPDNSTGLLSGRDRPCGNDTGGAGPGTGRYPECRYSAFACRSRCAFDEPRRMMPTRRLKGVQVRVSSRPSRHRIRTGTSGTFGDVHETV